MKVALEEPKLAEPGRSWRLLALAAAALNTALIFSPNFLEETALSFTPYPWQLISEFDGFNGDKADIDFTFGVVLLRGLWQTMTVLGPFGLLVCTPHRLINTTKRSWQVWTIVLLWIISVLPIFFVIVKQLPLHLDPQTAGIGCSISLAYLFGCAMSFLASRTERSSRLPLLWLCIVPTINAIIGWASFVYLEFKFKGMIDANPLSQIVYVIPLISLIRCALSITTCFVFLFCVVQWRKAVKCKMDKESST